GPCVPPRGENAYWSPLIERHPFLACNGVVHLPARVTCVAGLTPLGAAAVPAEFEHALGEGGDDLRLGHVDLRVQELDLTLGEQAVDGLSPGQFGLLPLGAVDAAHHGITVERADDVADIALVRQHQGCDEAPHVVVSRHLADRPVIERGLSVGHEVPVAVQIHPLANPQHGATLSAGSTLRVVQGDVMDVSPLTPLTPGDQSLHGVDAPAEHQESPIAHSSSSSGGYPLPPRAEAPDGRGGGHSPSPSPPEAALTPVARASSESASG